MEGGRKEGREGYRERAREREREREREKERERKKQRGRNRGRGRGKAEGEGAGERSEEDEGNAVAKESERCTRNHVNVRQHDSCLTLPSHYTELLITLPIMHRCIRFKSRFKLYIMPTHSHRVAGLNGTI